MSDTLLVMHDSPDFGGHEKMLLALLPAALDNYRQAIVCHSAENLRLAAELRALSPRLKLRPWPFAKRRGEPYLAPLRLRYRAAARQVHALERPRVTLLVQGRIENLAVPMTALPADARLVSYLPMAQSLKEMGRSGTGDAIRRRLYRRPNQFIVPSDAVAAQVRRAGGEAAIAVAPNVVDVPKPVDRATARAALGLAPDARVALFLGRLDTAQKGLDTLLAALERDRDSLAGWRFLFVGDGPGREQVARAAAASAGGIDLVSWSDQPGLYVAAADVLMLPSRWEGVPLVMLEAMTLGVPVLGSQIDVFETMLPPANRHDYAGGSLARALDGATADASVAAYRSHAAALLAKSDLATARKAFADALQAAA